MSNIPVRRLPVERVTYTETIQFLYELRLFGTKFGLENAQKLAALAGNPHEKLRFIHVAGTNGKGSTCAMLESIYRASGLRVGLFTSPHLVSFRERIQIGRQMISEEDVVRLVKYLQALLAEFPKEHHPTFFEVLTVMALKFFAERECELVVWETGLGGRLDATNIVTPLASVITNIAYDHQQWLGDTLAQIAFEKAGIIKPGIPAATATDAPEALAVIKRAATERHAPLTIVTGGLPEELVPLYEGAGPLRGEHQKRNAALALATVEMLQKQIPVSSEQIRAGLQTVSWAGRLQLIHRPDGTTILLDGAHNVAGAMVLRDTLQRDFAKEKKTIILGILEDKDWRQICQIVAPLADAIFAVPVLSKRTAIPMELAETCALANPAAAIRVCDSLKEALQKTSAADFLVVTGSLYLVGETLELLSCCPPARSEHELNEWGVAKG